MQYRFNFIFLKVDYQHFLCQQLLLNNWSCSHRIELSPVSYIKLSQMYKFSYIYMYMYILFYFYKLFTNQYNINFIMVSL